MFMPKRIVAALGAAVLIATSGAAGSVGAAAPRHHAPHPLSPPATPRLAARPCSRTWLKAIDCARHDLEGLPPLPLTKKALAALKPAEQLLALINLERDSRGLMPLTEITVASNTLALQGAQRTGLPTLTTTGLTPSTPTTSTATLTPSMAAAWVGGRDLTAPQAVFDLMYAGPRDPRTRGTDGASRHAGSSWASRDALLANLSACYTSPAPRRIGIADLRTPDGYVSIAVVLRGTCVGETPGSNLVPTPTDTTVMVTSPVTTAPTPGNITWTSVETQLHRVEAAAKAERHHHAEHKRRKAQ